jgi:hypothetical protein
VGLLDDGLAALGELDSGVGLVAGFLDLVAAVRGDGDVVGLDFVNFGGWVTTAPVPGCCRRRLLAGCTRSFVFVFVIHCEVLFSRSRFGRIRAHIVA